MASRKLSGSESDWISEESNSLKFLRLLKGETDGPDLSVTLVEIDGAHRKLRTLNSSRLYVILKGRFQFTVTPSNGSLASSRTIDASDSELILIERGDWYSLDGTGRYLVINGPAIGPSDDIYFDELPRD